MPAVDPHYLWALGHVVVLLGSAYTFLNVLFFRPFPYKSYRASYTGALLSYAIVVVKSLGVPSADQAWLRRALVDENVQYMILAVYWWISKPVSLSLLPFATFSLFHTLTFIRTNVIPKIAPTPPAAAGAAQQRPATLPQTLSTKIQLWVKGNYDPAMRFVAYAELVLLVRTTLGALTFQSSLLAPLFLAHFIRLRYHASPFTRQAVGNITARIDTFANQKGGGVANAWGQAKRIIGTWGGGKLVPQQAPAPAAAPAAGAARR